MPKILLPISHRRQKQQADCLAAWRELLYWEETADHAVVVVELDKGQVYLSDPDIPNAPEIVPIPEFELAWLEKDYRLTLKQLG